MENLEIKPITNPKEYCGKRITTINKGEPTCRATAVIPSIVVETTEGIKQMTNTLVRVSGNSSTYYVDDKHRVTLVCADPVEKSNYDFATNPDNIRGQMVFDKVTKQVYYYYKDGDSVEIQPEWPDIPKLYETMGQNTDGAVTQKLFTDTVGDIEELLHNLNSGEGV